MEPISLILSFLSGIAAHLIFWIRGERDDIFPSIFFTVSTVNVFVGLGRWCSSTAVLDIGTLLALEDAHVIGTFCSILVYRLCLHPLRSFPGSFWARVSVWWRFRETIRSNTRHSVMLHGLHAQYGDIIRVAPNQLSINRISSITLIHGSASRCTKSAGYINPSNPNNINADRDPKSHSLRRKQWDRALGSGAASTYAPRALSLCSLLLSRLDSHNGEPFNVNQYMHFFSFDFMGLVGFGKSYGQLETLQEHPTIRLIKNFMWIGVYMMQVPWLHCVLDSVPTPSFMNEYNPRTLRGYAEESLRHRIQNPPKEPDLMKYLLTPPNLYDSQSSSLSDAVSDSLIFQVGGSDTTTSASVHLFYRLARHKETQNILHAEICSGLNLQRRNDERDALGDICIPSITLADVTVLLKLPYLEAVINETLRLHPPSPSGLFRTTPPEGLQLPEGDFIPGGVDVSSPIFSLHRDPRYWAEPEAFIPERWIHGLHTSSPAGLYEPQPYLIKDRTAFMPFGIGPYGCAGRVVSYMEMKLLVASIVTRFWIDFPVGTDLDEIDRKVWEGWRDYNTVKAAETELRFLRRVS